MKEIKLTQGLFAQVDDEDFELMNLFKWTAHKNKYTCYAIRKMWINGKQKHFLLHNIIMNPPEGMEVDHEDHNGLNCQRHNMRNCIHSQNQCNRNASKSGTSKYLGVSLSEGKYIVANIRIKGKQKRLGTFKTEEDAARKYDEMAKIYHGEFANLNFKEAL